MGPPGPATRLLPPLVLALAGVARGTFTVVAWPRVAVVAFGGSVTVNCSRSACPEGDTNATLGLETTLPATPGPGGLRWQSFRLHNVSRWSPGPVTCSGRCGDTEANASAGVLVYQLPERVELEPVPAAAVGDSRNLTCHVRAVAPLRNLTVTLRRGAETLRTESFAEGAEGSASVAVSHVLTVTRGDHGQDVTCHAELSLRPHGPLFARAAVPVTLSVFALPEPPQLQAPAILEAGTVTNASCRITGAFPAGDVRVTAALDQKPLNVTVAVAGDTVTASTALSPLIPGPRELSCTAAVATVVRTARRQLHVYRFPAPALELSPAPAAAGSEVTVSCHAGATEPPEARLQLRDADGGVLAEGPQPRLQLRLLARRDDDGREFRCRASLAVGDSVVTKDADARLAVLYLPEIPASGCPGNRTWVQGAREALSCRATGNPAPTVVCGRDGVAVATGEPEPVTRARAGTYVCNATNALGTRSRRVTVRVEYEPTMSESGCPARRVWVEGQRRELECRADGDPPPSTRCARDGGTQHGVTRDGGTHHGSTQHGGTRDSGPRDGGTRDGGTRDGGTRDGGTRDGGSHHGGVTRGRVVTRADGGRYVCRATNRHGVAVRSVLVTVECECDTGEGTPGPAEPRRARLPRAAAVAGGDPGRAGLRRHREPPAPRHLRQAGRARQRHRAGPRQPGPGPCHRQCHPRPRGHVPVPGHQRARLRRPQRLRGRGVRPRRCHRARPALRQRHPRQRLHRGLRRRGGPGAHLHLGAAPRPKPALGRRQPLGHGHRRHHGQPGALHLHGEQPARPESRERRGAGGRELAGAAGGAGSAGRGHGAGAGRGRRVLPQEHGVQEGRVQRARRRGLLRGRLPAPAPGSPCRGVRHPAEPAVTGTGTGTGRPGAPEPGFGVVLGDFGRARIHLEVLAGNGTTAGRVWDPVCPAGTGTGTGTIPVPVGFGDLPPRPTPGIFGGILGGTTPRTERSPEGSSVPTPARWGGGFGVPTEPPRGFWGDLRGLGAAPSVAQAPLRDGPHPINDQ